MLVLIYVARSASIYKQRTAFLNPRFSVTIPKYVYCNSSSRSEIGFALTHRHFHSLAVHKYLNEKFEVLQARVSVMSEMMH